MINLWKTLIFTITRSLAILNPNVIELIILIIFYSEIMRIYNYLYRLRFLVIDLIYGTYINLPRFFIIIFFKKKENLLENTFQSLAAPHLPQLHTDFLNTRSKIKNVMNSIRSQSYTENEIKIHVQKLNIYSWVASPNELDRIHPLY